MKNNIGLLIGLVGPLLGTFVFVVALTHGLKVEEFNFFMYAYTLALLFNVLSDFGFRAKLYLEVKNKVEDYNHLYSDVLFYKFNMWCVSAILFILVSYLVFDSLNATILILSVYTGLNYVSDLSVSFFRGLAASEYETRLNVIEKVSFVLFLAFAYFSTSTPEAYALALVLSAAIRLVIGHIILDKYFGISWDCRLVNYHDVLRRFKQGFETGVATFIQVFVLRWSLIFLPMLGLYVIAGQVGVLLSLLQAFLVIPTYLSIRYFMGSKDKGYAFPLFICLIIGAILSLMLFLLIPVLNVLFNGVFDHNLTLVKYLFLMLPFLLANQFMRHYFIAKSKVVFLYNFSSMILLSLGICFLYIVQVDVTSFGLSVLIMEIVLFITGALLAYAK